MYCDGTNGPLLMRRKVYDTYQKFEKAAKPKLQFFLAWVRDASKNRQNMYNTSLRYQNCLFQGQESHFLKFFVFRSNNVMILNGT